MKRRTLLKSGLLLGSLLAGEQALNPEPAEAGLTVVFLDGTIDGGVLENWELWLAITGRRVTGFAFDPEDDVAGLTLRGRFHQGRVELSIFKLEDLQQENPVGSLSGRFRSRGIGLIGKPFHDGVLEGTFHLDDPKDEPSKGEFFARAVPISRFHTDRFAGVYEGQGFDEDGNLLVTAEVRVRRGGAYEIRNIQPTELIPEEIPLPSRLSGFLGVTPEGELWAVASRVPPSFKIGPLQEPPHEEPPHEEPPTTPPPTTPPPTTPPPTEPPDEEAALAFLQLILLCTLCLGGVLGNANTHQESEGLVVDVVGLGSVLGRRTRAI
jgi:hypothetical protein